MSNPITDATKHTVLLLDDDSFFLSMYASKFEKNGYTTQAHLTVDSALQSLRMGFLPDVIIFDIVMPEKTGFDFLQAVRSETLAPGALLMALTNEDHPEDRAHAAELGATMFMVKANMIPSEVVSAVDKAVTERIA